MPSKILSSNKIKILRFLKGKLSNTINLFLKIAFKINTKNYGVIISEAFYTPWNGDKKFTKHYNTFKKFTMLNDQRAYNIYKSINNIRYLRGDCVEIGCWKGGISFLISKKLKSINLNKTIHAFDTFKGVIKASKKDKNYFGGEHGEADINEIKFCINKFNLKNIIVHKGIFPDDFQNEKFLNRICFAHIDVDTYNSARDATKFIWNKLVKGGIILFDDYGFHQTEGIKTFVNNFSKENKCSFFYHTNGQAIVIKI